MAKFRKNDVVLLVNPKKYWGSKYAKIFDGELGLVVSRKKGGSSGQYQVQHYRLSISGPGSSTYAIHESEMIKIGTLGKTITEGEK